MALGLQVDEALSDSATQPVKDEGGVSSALSLSTSTAGVGTPDARALLEVHGDVHLERNGSPTLALRSRGNGTQHYSMRATNDRDDAGGRRFVIRNEDQGADNLILDNGGNVTLAGNLTLEKSGDFGSPTLGLHSHGNGTQHYSVRATNDRDPVGGRCFVIRNESQGENEIVLDAAGNVTFRGDIRLAGADCAEAFEVEAAGGLEPGTVLVIGDADRLRQCSRPYDRRVVGVVSGAGDRRAGLVLGAGAPATDRLPVALIGTVFCKVDADHAPIEVGDLLTTSSSEGHAMKAEDAHRAMGAVIGKALRPAARGRTLIPIVVALQ